MDFDQILPNLYVGSYPGTADDVHQLRATGITAVLNVQSDDDCEHLGIDWSAIETLRDLQTGLVTALQQMGKKLV